MSAELHYRTLTSLAQPLRRGELGTVDLTEAVLARIERHDPYFRAYAEVMAEPARRAAHQMAGELASGRDRGPLHGIPVAVKDLCDVAGYATVGGAAVLRDNIADTDATVVRRLREAGAVLIGKLNLTEGAMGGYNPALAVPQNPWREDHWPGASSSGSGTAAAAGLAYATLGSDTGGSIRHPAAVCGVVGLKPTWGRVSRAGVLDLAQSLDHVGPLTRSVRDAAAVLQAIAGPDPRDPTTLPGPVPDFLCEIGAPVRGLRIGWDARYASEDLAPDHARAIEEGCRQLERLGAEVVPVSMPGALRAQLEAWPVLCTCEAFTAHAAYFPRQAADYGPWFRQWLHYGSEYTGADYARAHHLRLQCAGAVNALLAEVDALVCPSTAREAYPMTPDDAYGPIPVQRDPWHSRFTVPMDYAGVPTVSVPCGLSEAGLPLSLQFVGRAGSEARVLRLAHAYEEATEWHRSVPPEPSVEIRRNP